jgi:ATP-dependent RNA helicase DDX5/DBP2
MFKEIEALVQEYLSQPIRVKVARVNNSAKNVNQTLENVNDKEKID